MKWPRLSLRWQLMISYLPLLLTPILVFSIVTQSVAEHGLSVLVTQEAERRARYFSTAFADYYSENKTWSGALNLLDTPAKWPRPRTPIMPPKTAAAKANPVDDKPKPPKPEQVIVVDTNNVIVASDSDKLVGQTLTTEAISHGAPLYINDTWIGTLVVGAASDSLSQQQRQLFDAITAALLISAGVSLLLTIIIGLWFSGQITAPIKRLMIGVKGLASGQWSTPVKVTAQNEFADLTRAFNEMATEVTHQQQLRQQMVADIAHDLRTPLSVMALEIQAIQEGMQTPVEAAASLQEEVTWLQRLVNDLHILSLMDADQMILQREPTDLNRFLKNVYTRWQSLAERENHALNFEASTTLPISAIDPDRMRQVLGNLLDNAIYHTEPGTQITLRAANRHDQLVIDVTDNGAGIYADDLPHIFDRFYRADRSRSRKKKRSGSGLGLSIAHRLVELHGGKLEVCSQAGQGTTFTVVLPTC